MRTVVEYRFVVSLILVASWAPSASGCGPAHGQRRSWSHLAQEPTPLRRPGVHLRHAVDEHAVLLDPQHAVPALHLRRPLGLTAAVPTTAAVSSARGRQDLFLVLGERHHRTSVKRAVEPQWLTIPERGLYTGVAIIGATGLGKTSACLHPYLEQLLAFQANDAQRKVGGLFLEVKGDFCPHVRDTLTRHGREQDYVEVSLDSPYRYNPLHNDLDAYELAYGIATLVTNLFGRGKEPFWQQASTNLVKFVILLHQVLDDYVTLVQVYEHVISPAKL